MGIQHLALYVDDLNAAAERLRRHGVTSTGPTVIGTGVGEGNRFIYARTPWGLTVELISYPAAMAYDNIATPTAGGRRYSIDRRAPCSFVEESGKGDTHLK